MAAVMITPFIATVPELWGSSVQRKRLVRAPRVPA